MSAPEPTLASPVVARMRWRAELLTFAAETLKADDLPAAARKMREADDATKEANLLEALLAAKASGTRAERRAAARQLANFRRRSRERAVEDGTRGRAAVLDDFDEPSDDELIGA